MRTALGNLFRWDTRHRERLRQVDPGQQLERPRIRDLVYAAAHQQVSGERPRRWMVDRLVDLELAVACAGFEEEIVGQVLDQVAGREDVIARPWRSARVDREDALAGLE